LRQPPLPSRADAGPYRASAEHDEHTLVYTPEEAEKHVASARRALKTFLATSIAGSALIMMGWGISGAVIGLGGVALAVTRWRARPTMKGITLRITKGELTVTQVGSEVVLSRIAVREIEDVRLETKCYTRANRAAGAVGALQFDGRGTPTKVNVSRIVIAGGPRELRLSEEFLAHVDCVEWLGTIRQFLRSHAWVPADERRDVE
jgi:hypothetical protein